MKRIDRNSIGRSLEELERKFGDLGPVKERVKRHEIETPSWGYADSGTRFATFRQPGAARTPWEKIEDAGAAHRFTGAAPSVALHLAWDRVEDYGELAAYAKEHGVRIGAINPDLFSEQDYKLGSLTNESASIRKRTLEHLLWSIEVAQAAGSEVVSIWFGDGTNFPGQGDFRRRKQWMQEGLQSVHDALPDDMRMMLEYKLFEPAFYHTDMADWGMAYTFCLHLGDRAFVLVDLGHHALGTNIEHIVAFLIAEGRLGGFHLNAKKYADDDLTVGSINPYELFLIYNEIAAAEDDPNANANIGFMLDQSHNLKPKIEATIQSIMTCQSAYARAALVDRKALAEAQHEGDIIRAENILQDAYYTDVRPLLAQIRIESGLDPDPLEAFRASGYMKKVRKARA